jgi:hypothetical protein
MCYVLDTDRRERRPAIDATERDTGQEREVNEKAIVSRVIKVSPPPRVEQQIHSGQLWRLMLHYHSYIAALAAPQPLGIVHTTRLNVGDPEH